MKATDFYSCERLTDRLYHIIESYAPCRDPGFDNGSIFNIYVVVGNEKIAVVDTGLGAADGLRAYIETTIDCGNKPLIALLGHCHPDHCGAAALFDEVYFNSGELADLDWNSNIDRRMSDLLLFADYREEVIAFCRKHYVKGRITADTPHRLAEEGDRIDLGGVVLTVVKVPGHSEGSVLYWNEEEHWALGSDSIQILNNYKGGIDQLKVYRNYLEKAISLLPEDIKIYSGHDRIVHDKATLYLMREALDDIIYGRNLKHDIPKPPRFAMTKPGPRTMIHRLGHIRAGYSSDIWNNYSPEEEKSVAEIMEILEAEHGL